MMIPVLEVAIVASALTALIAFGAMVKWTRGRKLPTSLKTIQIGIALFVVGIIVRVAEAAVQGALVFPGYADLFTVPAYAVVTLGVARAGMSRHALAKSADLIDAAAISAAVVTIAIALSTRYITDSSHPLDERALALGYALIELVFLAFIIVMVFGPAPNTRCTIWVFVAGLYATTFDTVINIAYAFDQPWIADNLLRTLALPIAFYAVATSFADYESFARPGTRRQRHRWLHYPAAFAAMAAVVAYQPGPIALFGLMVFAGAVSAKIAVGHTITSRLTLLGATQSAMSTAIADADSAPAALESGVEAVRAILMDPDARVEISTDSLPSPDAPPDAVPDSDPPTTVITSRDASLRITVDADTKPHQWSAIEQIADLLSYAVVAVEARTERITARTEANWRALSGANNELVFIIDTDRMVTAATPNAASVLGMDPTGQPLVELLGCDPKALTSASETITDAVTSGDDPRWMAISSQPASGGRRVVTVTDATARVVAEYIDSTTGLTNLNDLLSRPPISAATLIMFRVDNLARINDSLGKSGADAVLNILAERLKTVFRDGIDDCWRGDGANFFVVCQGAEQSDQWVAARRDAIAAPVTTSGGRTSYPTITAVVVPVTDETPVDLVLHRADITAAEANADSRDGVLRFTAELEQAAQRRYRIEEALAAMNEPAALGFRPHYQPIVAALTGEVDRVEALLRWQHPTLGTVRPDEFIPAAERTGHIAALDQFVLERATADLGRFAHVAPHLEMQINLSPVGLTVDRLNGLADWVNDHLTKPPKLTVEIIESEITGDFDLLIPALQVLRDAGVGIALDDFGIGASDFSRLTRGPWTQVKLAGMFATDIAPATVERVIATIKSLGHTVVVENVEEQTQAAAMQAAGADLIQGWLISKDLPADDLMAYLGDKAAVN